MLIVGKGFMQYLAIFGQKMFGRNFFVKSFFGYFKTKNKREKNVSMTTKLMEGGGGALKKNFSAASLSKFGK